MIQVKGLDKIAQKLDGINKFPEVLRDLYDEKGEEFVQDVREHQMSGRPGLIERTGALKQSLEHRTTANKTSVTASIGTEKVYFNPHQYGYKQIPKRLHVIEKMEADYEKQYVDLIKETLDKILGK